LREAHPAGREKPSDFRAKRVGMVSDEDSGLIMKLRGMISTLTPGLPRLNPFCYFFVQPSFFSFHLTGTRVSCNHHRLTVA
jgi:hypothetical protein